MAAVLTINEIFHSIQGESTHAGRPCVFVRLTACDLRCSWCDTPYAFTEGHKISIEDVVAASRQYGCPVVEITGGEPLLQKNVYPLMQRLLDEELTVMLETGGHLSIEQVPRGVVRIMDVKCPGSGESHRNDWTNMDRLVATDEVKFVIQGSRRLRVRLRRRRQLRPDRARRRGALFAGARRARIEAARRMDPEDRLEVRLQLQVHKYIWDPDDTRRMKAVVLLSGGLDSYTAAAVAQTRWVRAVRAHGQLWPDRTLRELESARPVARALGVSRHIELDVNLAAFGGSSLVGVGAIPKDRAHLDSETGPASARSRPPMCPRATPSSCRWRWRGRKSPAAEAIVIGVNALDYSGYPDCRPEYLAAFAHLASLATRAGVEGRPFQVLAPLLHLSKADIIRLGADLGLDYGLTHSCYAPTPEGRPCGHCDSCRLRAKGFAEAGIRGSYNEHDRTALLHRPALRPIRSDVSRASKPWTAARSSASIARRSIRPPVDSRSTSARSATLA